MAAEAAEPINLNQKQKLPPIQIVKTFPANVEKKRAEKLKSLQEQCGVLSDDLIAQYRFSHRQLVSTAMLREGAHNAFTELLMLVRQQEQRIREAGQDAVFLGEYNLDDRPESLNMLRTYLARAEEAERSSDFKRMYDEILVLATFFEQKKVEGGGECKWIADHFYKKLLDIGARIKNDGGRTKAEAHRNMGLAHEKNGKLEAAAQELEEFYKLSSAEAVKNSWWDDAGVLFVTTACENLARVYGTLAQEHEERAHKARISEKEKEKQQAGKSDGQLPKQSVAELQLVVDYRLKAYERSKEKELSCLSTLCAETGQNVKLEAECSFHLGQAFENNGRSEQALYFLRMYYETCKAKGDAAGQCEACAAMSAAYESIGRMDSAIEILHEFIGIAERARLEEAYSRACCLLGNVLNQLSRYEEACDYFNKAYTLARARNDTRLISSSRVQFGIAQAHKMYTNFAVQLEMASRHCIKTQLEWKSTRVDKFNAKIPDIKDPKIRDERPEGENPIENGSIPPNYRPEEADSTGRVSGTLTDTASYHST